MGEGAYVTTKACMLLLRLWGEGVCVCAEMERWRRGSDGESEREKIRVFYCTNQME